MQSHTRGPVSDPESEQTYPSVKRTATERNSSRRHVVKTRLRTSEESGPLRYGYPLRHRPTAANAASTKTLHKKSPSNDVKNNTIKYEETHTALIGRQLYADAMEGAGVRSGIRANRPEGHKDGNEKHQDEHGDRSQHHADNTWLRN